jgi:tetratricopeptide (TPR) repeat protein
VFAYPKSRRIDIYYNQLLGMWQKLPLKREALGTKIPLDSQGVGTIVLEFDIQQYESKVAIRARTKSVEDHLLVDQNCTIKEDLFWYLFDEYRVWDMKRQQEIAEMLLDSRNDTIKVEARYILGAYAHWNKDYMKAIDHYRGILEITGNVRRSSKFLLFIAACYYQMDMYDIALEEIALASNLNQDDPKGPVQSMARQWVSEINRAKLNRNHSKKELEERRKQEEEKRRQEET